MRWMPAGRASERPVNQGATMFDRSCSKALILTVLMLPIAGCGTSLVDSIAVTPSSQSAGVGQTAQFTATGTYSHGSHPSSTQNLTNTATWTSSAPAVATVNAQGVATADSAGTTTISASVNGFNGVVSGSATLTVTGTGTSTGQGGNVLVSLTIIPSSITVDNLQDTGQFLAVGTFSQAPYVQDLTNSTSLTWISSEPDVFPVDNSNGTNTGTTGGIVTAYGSGSANIIAEATYCTTPNDPSTCTIQTASATFSCPLVEPPPPGSPSQTPGTCYPGSQAPALNATITIYNEGLNATNWLVTAPSATGTPDVIHCGPGWTGTGGSVCSAAYPIGNTVVLTAPAGAGNFGGWSSSCSSVSPNPSTAAGPNTCTVVLSDSNTNVTIGAIFN